MDEDKIEVVEYDPDWPGQFLIERDAIRLAVGSEAAVIEHVGSTAIAGAKAKPTIDIMVGVSNLTVDNRVVSILAGLGYKHFGEFGIPGRHFFRKGSPPTHHLHWVVQDGDFWQRQLLFRDFMRRHPEELRKYENLKSELAAELRHERSKYTSAKTEFITGVLERAKIWRDGRPDYYIICDLEAACWENDKTPEKMETIEVGAVKIRAADFSIVGEFCAFVRPKDSPQLSDFCKNLTSISQKQVDEAKSFPEVISQFYRWIGPEPMRFCSWGSYDLRQLRNDCERHQMALPAEFERHLNLRALFAQSRGIQPVTMAQALGLTGVDLSGTPHRGIDDARNIAKLAQGILGAPLR